MKFLVEEKICKTFNCENLCDMDGSIKKYRLTANRGKILKTEKISQWIFYVPKILKTKNKIFGKTARLSLWN